MKRHSEAIARQEPIFRKVKKGLPPMFHYWNRLPNEMKVAIAQKMDVATSVSFSESGRNELELVQNHTKHSVDILLESNEYSPQGGMVICVRDVGSETNQLKWFIHKNQDQLRRTVVEHHVNYSPRSEPRTFILDGKSAEETVSMILRRLLTKQTFVVNELTLKLWEYNQRIDLASIKAEVNLLTLMYCYNSEPVFSMFRNESVNFKKVVGTNYSDRRILYEFDTLTYGRPRTIPAISSFPIGRDGFSFLSLLGPRCYQQGYERLKGLWDITLGFYNFVNIDDVNKKLELRKTTDDIMMFRAAYDHADNIVPYIQNEANNAEDILYAYSDRIAFLKDGIDDHLSDYQIIVLSIAYLVRLFRNEPQIRKIYDIAFEDLRLVLKKYENVNLYEKLVAKLEALLP